MQVNWIETPDLGDERGSLVVYEYQKQIPFEIKRTYFIFGSDPEIVRGRHAHKSLKQVITCIQGKCLMKLDDGKYQASLVMNNPCQGILLPPHYWHEMHQFEPNTVLAVFCDQLYDEDDYLRDYDQFLAYHCGS